MSIVYACIAPHSGTLLLPDNTPTPIPQTRAAMRVLQADMEAARPDTICVLTPHGVYVEGHVSLGVTARAFGELDGTTVDLPTDLDLAHRWAYHAGERGIPIACLAPDNPDEPFPLDWGVVIPVALTAANLAPPPSLVVACPGRELSDTQLADWGEALAVAADELGTRVALIASADQGHGHAADGPYGFNASSARYDADMRAAVESDDLSRLLSWPASYPEDALADSYWQTLPLLGVQKRVPLRARFLSYEIDHYFGLLCASFALPT